MAEFEAADKKEPPVAAAPNEENDASDKKDKKYDTITKSEAAIYGYMWKTEDFLNLSEEAKREFLKIWCNKQTPAVKNVMAALKDLEFERVNAKVQYEKQLAELKVKHHNELQEIYKQRADIIRGTVEPELVEAPWMEKERKMIEESVAALDDVPSVSHSKHLLGKPKPMPADAKGIPRFWLHLLKNLSLTDYLIEEADEPLLEKLYDIKVVQENIYAFVLEFYFEKNEYFTNDKLYKTYTYEYDYDEEEPFEYNGPYLKSCTGCTIDWLPGKNLTVDSSSKQLKAKRSFFNLFKTAKANDIDACKNKDELSELLDDLDLGDQFKNEIIPKAVLYYAGNIVHEDDMDESDSSSEYSASSTNYEEEEDQPGCSVFSSAYE